MKSECYGKICSIRHTSKESKVRQIDRVKFVSATKLNVSDDKDLTNEDVEKRFLSQNCV